MTFDIYFGIPEIKDLWEELTNKVNLGLATREEIKFKKKLTKTLLLLQSNPHHNSLKTHEIKVLTERYGMKVWQSYIENNKPAAGRIYWVYYPSNSITIIGIEQHPNKTKFHPLNPKHPIFVFLHYPTQKPPIFHPNPTNYSKTSLPPHTQHQTFTSHTKPSSKTHFSHKPKIHKSQFFSN